MRSCWQTGEKVLASQSDAGSLDERQTRDAGATVSVADQLMEHTNCCSLINVFSQFVF